MKKIVFSIFLLSASFLVGGVSFECRAEDIQSEESASLKLAYTINPKGTLKVEQNIDFDEAAWNTGAIEKVTTLTTDTNCDDVYKVYVRLAGDEQAGLAGPDGKTIPCYVAIQGDEANKKLVSSNPELLLPSLKQGTTQHNVIISLDNTVGIPSGDYNATLIFELKAQ